jgi:YVTN family beta-propeller protein
MEGGTVSVVSTRANKRVATIPVGKTPVQIAFAPDGRFAYVSLNGEDAVGKIDVAKRRLVEKVKVGDGPVQLFVTPDKQRLLVANQGTEARPGKTLSIVETATFEKVRDVATGKGPHGVVIDPAGSRAYVTNLYEGTVAVVDLDDLRVVARVRVGKEPNGISFSRLAPTKPHAAVVHLPLPAMPGMEMGHS